MKPNFIQLVRAHKAISRVLLLAVCGVLYVAAPVFGQATVTKQFYLSDPSQALDRISPVATADGTVAQTQALTPGSRYLYALRGASRTDFWRYDISSGNWTSMASTPAVVSRGGSLATNGTLIYALRGATSDFWEYNPATNLWTVRSTTPAPVTGGGALIHVNGALYAFQGGSNAFWKYTIATNTWSVMANTPANTGWGAALTTNGTDIFATRGANSNAFWKYTVATNTWSSLATLPSAVDAGGALSFDGNSVTALRGGNFTNFFRYNTATNTWATLANTPNAVGKGGALASDDPVSYAFRGNLNNNFWRFDGTSWTSLSNAPSSVDSGAAIIKMGTIARTTTFTQAPAMCATFRIKAGAVSVSLYTSIVYGSMPVNPAATAVLRYAGVNIITLSNPVYNSGTGMLTFTGTLPTDAMIPSSQALALDISTSQPGVSFRIDYDAQTKPSRIDLLTNTYTSITAMNVYSLPYPLGTILTNVLGGTTRYIRTTATNPTGFADINSADITITPPGSTSASPQVAASGCTKVFESPWVVPSGIPSFNITATVKDGLENTITTSRNITVNGCNSCPPTANKDEFSGNGGEPLEMDVLANDTDPNNDIDPSSLTVLTMPKNGDIILDNNRITYLPNGNFSGNDTLVYEICDNSLITPQCATAQVIINIKAVTIDVCGDAVKDKIYYMPYSENEAIIALRRSASVSLSSSNIRTIISIKISYPGTQLVWDNWEDGYEPEITSPVQPSTQVWGDGDIYNGIAPGYPTDVIPPGGSIVLDNTMPTPRNVANIFYDGKDKLYSTTQVAVTQVCGEPSDIAVQCMKTNVSSYPSEYGKQFVVPVGQDLPSRDFSYTALFIRAAEDNTTVQIDRDNDGTFNSSVVMNEGDVILVDEFMAPAGTKIKAGAVIASDKPIGVDAHFAGIDNFSSREVPIFPATWYSHTYYTPVPTTGPATAPHDTAVVMLYNTLNRAININWSSGIPSSGTINLPANSSHRFAMPLSATAAYKFVNPTKEAFVAIEIVDSYTPGGGGNEGSTRDWAFNLISEARLTDFASVAWAPGSTDGSRNDNPIWVTPSANTTIYVKYDGDVLNGVNTSPCGMKYDVAIPLNMLNHTRIRDANDNSQSGTAVYTCDGTKIAAVYGEDPQTAQTANPSWDVGSTIQPFCKDKLVIANNDYAVTLVNTPVTIPVMKNDAGFLAVLDPSTVTTLNLMQPENGTVEVLPNGSIVYIPNTGFAGIDSFQYTVCSTPTPVVCASAFVYVTIAACPSPTGMNIISGQVFLDKNQDGSNNDGGTGMPTAKIYLYVDGNCNNFANSNELVDSVNVDVNGQYQFIKSPEKTVADDFDITGGGNDCADGSDGTAAWVSTWYDIADRSAGFCVTPPASQDSTDVEIVQDSTFGYALRLDDNNRAAVREFNMQFATRAFLSFSFRRASSRFSFGENIAVQLSADGVTYNTVYTISGTGAVNTSYFHVSNLTINAAAYSTNDKTYLRFMTNNNMDEGDFVFIDNVSVKYLQYDQCYLIGLATSSLPANTALTTAALRSFKFNTSGTCANDMDFGVKRILTYSVNDENSTWQNTNVTGVVKHNDFDQEGNSQVFGSFLNPLTRAVIGSGSSINGTDKSGAAVANAGTLTFDAAGVYTFAPAPSFTGTVTIPYRICDNGSPAACDTASLTITVDPQPAAGNSVIANNDEDITYGNAISGNLFANDRDPKYYTFTATLFSYDTNGDGIPDITSMPGTVTVAGVNIYGAPVSNAGVLTVNANGTYTFTPASGFTGSVTASYIITNTAGAVSRAGIHIEVLANINGTQNDPPFAGDDFGYTSVNQPVTGSFITNDRDNNNDTLSYNGTMLIAGGMGNAIGTPVATIQGGTVQFYANGTYRYTPPLNYTGPDYVTYSICDVTTTAPQPLCAAGMIHFLVTPGINISGKVWDDGNGNVTKQAHEIVTDAGGALYVNLVDAMGYVVATTKVDSDGTYNFANAAPGLTYSIVLSTTAAAPGAPAPAASLPDGWTNTGENRNGVIDYGAMGVIDSRLYGFTNAGNLDFGIELLPSSVPFYVNIAQPTLGQIITLNGGSNPPVLSGKDEEDCTSGCTLDARNVVIDVIPNNADLLYNGVLVTAGQLIINFNPNLLQVQFTTATLGSNMTEFFYSFVDSAGKKDPVTAIYSINWLTLLPVKGLELTAIKAGKNVMLNWKTLSEINSDHFEIERSIDGRNYVKVGSNMAAAGNSEAEKQYQSADDISSISKPVVYYRIKLLDKAGKYAYSNVATVKLPENGALVKVVPNPFISEITITVSVEQSSSFGIRMLDMSGRTISNNAQKITRENPTVTLRNLSNLVRGMYIVEVTDTETGKKNVFKVEKAY